MKKYVIYMGVIFMPDGNAAAQRAQSFIQIIKQCGFVPIILGMTNDCNYDSVIGEPEKYQETLVFSNRYPNNSIDWLKMLFDVSQVNNIIDYIGAQNIQAIIAMDYFAPALYRILKICKKKNIKFIADAVDWFTKSNYPFPKGLIKDFDTSLRMNYIYKHIDHLITISRYLKQYYSPYVNQVVEIPGIVVDHHPDPSDYKCNQFITLCFVGIPGPSCCKEKIDWVIRSICRINSIKDTFRFVVAGVNRQFFEKDRPDLVSHAMFDSSVKCLGRISHLECLNLIQESDFSVIIRENSLLSNAGFPTKLGESFSCGTPVIATPTSNISDYIPTKYGFISEDCTEESVYKLLDEISIMPKSVIEDMHKTVMKDNPLGANAFFQVMKEVLI